METENAQVLGTRRYGVKPAVERQVSKDEFVTQNFHLNRAYIYAKERGGKEADLLLDEMKRRYAWYRENWRMLPARAIKEKAGNTFVDKFKVPPLSIDIELAAICNLVCPFCFRQWIATPDKCMDSSLAFKLIDQAVELGVPSIKFNWRGEPMMHPKLAELINYAKKKGILETIINTNATLLNHSASVQLIEAGLDILIYSFDGGTEESYNQMRPGRFKSNSFNKVYKNIQDFEKLRTKMGAVFPFTKIQMVLTEETFSEQEEYYNLFQDCVDEVTTTAYMERGGNMKVLQPEEHSELIAALPEGQTDLDNVRYWKEVDGDLYLETGRLPCEQPFQRLMISYDGRVFMCCIDWGNEHPVGYVAGDYFTKGDADYEMVMDRARNNKRGFDSMNLDMPSRYTNPEKKVRSLADIWNGREINAVRELHVNGKLETVPVCKKCTFVDTYSWKKIR